MTFVRTVTENQIPVVDITALVRGEAAVDVGKSLHQASSNLGFIYVKGHGLEAQLLRDLRHVGMEFSDCLPRRKAAATPPVTTATGLGQDNRRWMIVCYQT